MRRLPLIIVLLGLVAGSSADPNDLSGGVLIAHAISQPLYGNGADLCAYYEQFGIATCEEQDTNMETSGYAQHMLFYVVAAFHEDKTWCGTQFGLGDVTGSDDYFYFVAGGDANICLPNALSTTSGAYFPMENEGIAIVATDTPWEGNFLPICWVECYSYYAGGDYDVPLGYYPGDPPLAVFGNCDVPSIIWDIACLGVMGVGANTGAECCPEAPVSWACCFFDGTCGMLTEYDCTSQGGDFMGDSVTCDDDPYPCIMPPIPGACCLESGECAYIGEEDCTAIGGEFLGELFPCEPDNPCPQPTVACCLDDELCLELTADECTSQGGFPEPYPSTCDPNPCLGSPANDDSWGSIKALYR